MLLSDTGISSKKFWSIHVNSNQNQISMFCYFDKDLAKTLSRLCEAKLSENGFVEFNFTKYETSFGIILC